jgi:hypothetical protein
METFITMRALAASPLMMGGDLPSLDDFALKLITDREMLACNQNGVMGSLVVDEGGVETWRVFEKGFLDRGWIGVFNRLDEPVSFKMDMARLDFSSDFYHLTNVWGGDEISFGSMVRLQPNGVLFIRFRRGLE